MIRRNDDVMEKLEDLEARLDALGPDADELRRLRDNLVEREDEVQELKSRVDDLQRGVYELARRFGRLAATRQRLDGQGLDVALLPDWDPDDKAPEAVLEEMTRRLDETAAAAETLLDRVGGEELDPARDASDVLAGFTHEHSARRKRAAEADGIADLYRLWIDSDQFDRYQRELVAPFARAVLQALEARPRPDTIQAGRQALPILKGAFQDSTTYLLRRSEELDGYRVDVEVDLDRLDSSPDLALARYRELLDELRGVGAVDFFHNVYVRLSDAVEEGRPGAGAAAWILSDAAVATLTDDGIRSWIADRVT